MDAGGDAVFGTKERFVCSVRFMISNSLEKTKKRCVCVIGLRNTVSDWSAFIGQRP